MAENERLPDDVPPVAAAFSARQYEKTERPGMVPMSREGEDSSWISRYLTNEELTAFVKGAEEINQETTALVC